MGRYDPDRHHRRSIRLPGYDYASAGGYFVTICAQDRECLFGEVVDGEMRLNDAGRMVEAVWESLPERFPGLVLDILVVMPNHVHGVIFLDGDAHGDGVQGDHKDRPYTARHAAGTGHGTVSRIMQAFKSITATEYVRGVKEQGWPAFGGRVWQRNYYEHVIRNDEDLDSIREYIANNPARWHLDRENPAVGGRGR